MIRKFVQFVGLILCLFVYGCDDSANLDTLLTVAPDLIAPDTEGVVTDLTPEVWEKLRFVREFQMLQHLTGPPHYFWLLEGSPDYDPERDAAWHAAEETKIARIKVIQEELYNRHIDADGISIIGNEVTPDKYFVMARNILLILTSKHPRLREPLRDHFYFIVVGGVSMYKSVLTHRRHDAAYLSLVPEYPIHLLALDAALDPENTTIYYTPNPGCDSRGVTLDIGTRTPSGLVKRAGWCTSPVFFGEYYPHRTFVHEFIHALDHVMADIDPTFRETLKEAHRKSVFDEGLWFPFPINWRDDILQKVDGWAEWWPSVLELWFFETGPGLIFESHQDFEEYDPRITEIIRQWFPEVLFFNTAEYRL